MSRFIAAAATLTLGLFAYGETVLAQPPAPAVQESLPRPADATTRASYERADALSRSIFWGQEQQVNPMDPVAGVRMAQALRELGQFDQAAHTAQGVLTLQPQNVEAMLELGRAHIARGQAFYGIAALEQARDQVARDWRALSLLGVAYTQVRRFDDAQQAWGEALRRSPDNPDVLTNIAMAHLGRGEAPAAESLLRKAVQQPHAGLQVRQNLALALGLQGKIGEAEQILRRDQPPEVADANLHWLTERMGHTGPATPSPSSAARIWPTG